MLQKLRDSLRVLFTPSVWFQNNRYSPKWEAELNALMATHRFTVRGEFTARLGEKVIWIENHPYASMSPEGWRIRRCRPRRITILRAYDKLCAETKDPREY